jgi:hypothetical protein
MRESADSAGLFGDQMSSGADDAYLITVASKGRLDQPDRLHAKQFGCFLVHSHVPAERITIHIPRVAGVTVDNPRAHPDCPELHLPPALEARVETDWDQMWDRVVHFFRDVRVTPGIRRVVWAHFGFGAPQGLVFPVLNEVSVPVPAWQMADLFRGLAIPAIVILDACYSGTIVRDVMQELPESAPVAFLTSGPLFCSTSAHVISERAQGPLPKVTVEFPPWTFTNMGYRVGHSMFGRGWVREAMYSATNVLFSALPALLNGNGRGFKAEYLTKCAGMLSARLRDFLPPPVEPSEQVGGYGDVIVFEQIIPSAPVGELYDDRDAKTGVGFDDQSLCNQAFVLVDAASQCFADRSPRSGCILERGLLEGFLSGHETDKTKTAHIAEFFCATQMESGDEKERIHLPLLPIVSMVIESLKDRHEGLSCDESVAQRPAEWQRLAEAIWELNGGRGEDLGECLLLAGWTVGVPLEEVMELFRKNRATLARQSHISLAKEEARYRAEHAPRTRFVFSYGVEI